MSARSYRSARPAICALALAVASATPVALGATPLLDVRVSPDTTVQLGAAVVGHEAIVRDDLGGSFTIGSIGAIPAQADLDAYHRRTNGHQLLSFDTTIQLPGGVTAQPADVIDYDGSIYTILFNAAAAGVPASANVDAVAVRGTGLLLSFDTTVDLGSVRADDEDFVLLDQGAFSMFFDGSAAGIDPALDLDGADLLECNDHLLLSFDGSGTIGGVTFDDEDVVEYDRASTWQMAYDGSARDPDWSAADLDAISATVNPGPGPPAVFGQTVRANANKVSFQWNVAAQFRAVRGAFALPAQVGAYAVTMSWSGSGTSFIDAAVPPASTGLWYLVKPAGCTQTSWQSTLGAEPGRDAAIP